MGVSLSLFAPKIADFARWVTPKYKKTISELLGAEKELEWVVITGNWWFLLVLWTFRIFGAIFAVISAYGIYLILFRLINKT